MGRFIIPIALAVSLIIAFSCEQQTRVANEKLSLMQADSAFAKMSEETNAAEAFKAYLADSAMQMPEGRDPVIGRDVIYERMSKNAAKYTLTWEPQNGGVAKSGDLGWTWGNSTFIWTDENGVEQHSYGKYLNVWQKQPDGTWKVLVDIGNERPAPSE
jgi:ketosteroid isomerase-like protein